MKSLIRKLNNTFSLQAYQVLRYGMFFLSGVIFTRSGLSLTGIGGYEAFIFMAGALSFFGISAIINSTLSAYRESEEKKSSFFFNVFLFMFLFGSILAILVLGVPQIAHSIFGLQLGVFEIRMLALYLLIGTPTYLLEYIYLLKNQPYSILVYGIISIFLHCLLVIAPVLITGEIVYALAGLVFTALIKFIWVVFLISKNSIFKWDSGIMAKQFKASLPLALAAFFSGCADYIDGIIVSNYYDKSVFAIFRYGARELPFSMLLANAMSMSFISRISANTSSAIAEIRKKSLRLMHFLFPLSMLCMLISNYAYSHIFNEHFSASAAIFNIYLLLIVSRLIFPQTILLGLGKSKIILFTSIIEIVINIAVSLILMQWFGLAGIAYGTVVAFYFDKLILVYFTRRITEIKVNQYIPLVPYIVYSLLLWILYLLQLNCF